MTTAPRWRLQKFLLTVYLNYETCVYILVRWSSPMPSVYLALSLRLDPHFMLLVYYVYFWWGDHYHRMLSSAQHHYQALSMLFISCCHHHQSTTVDWVYFYKVVIISGHPHNLLTSFYLYNFGKVIIITGRPHDLWTTFTCIFLVRWSSSTVTDVISYLLPTCSLTSLQTCFRRYGWSFLIDVVNVTIGLS